MGLSSTVFFAQKVCVSEKASCTVTHGHQQVPAVKHQIRNSQPATSIEKEAAATTCQANTGHNRLCFQQTCALQQPNVSLGVRVASFPVRQLTAGNHSGKSVTRFNNFMSLYCRILDNTRWFARLRTFALETLLMNEWGMRRILQKQHDRKAFSLLQFGFVKPESLQRFDQNRPFAGWSVRTTDCRSEPGQKMSGGHHVHKPFRFSTIWPQKSLPVTKSPPCIEEARLEEHGLVTGRSCR